MRLNKAEKIAALIALCFALILAGYIIGSESGGGGFALTAAKDGVSAAEASMSMPPESLEPTEDSKPETKPSESAVLFPLDINRCSSEELVSLPGIGEALAARIIAYREENGGFSHIEELMDVRGIGEGIFANIKDMVNVNSA